jgi:hypothetical protein
MKTFLNQVGWALGNVHPTFHFKNKSKIIWIIQKYFVPLHQENKTTLVLTIKKEIMNQKLGLMMFGTFFAFASYHQLFIKMLEPGLLPAPLRIARGSRVVYNPSRGSAVLYQICDMA